MQDAPPTLTAAPALVLAPMQEITRLPFMRALAGRSLPDWFVTEYFRVHPDSHLNRDILKCVVANDTGLPVFAQMIGDDIPSLVRTARELAAYPVAGVDLNLGCPAPIVCRKRAGGGLLRDPEHLRRVLGELRAAIPGRFTVKTRLGYENSDEFGKLLDIFKPIGLDGISIHARTVKQSYQGQVHTGWVAAAVRALGCPVIANGNIVDPATARSFLDRTGAAGLMIGRGAIRNPWLFGQIRDTWAGRDIFKPTNRNLLEYIADLYDGIAAASARFVPEGHVQRMKRTLGYVAHGVGNGFEHALRRSRLPEDFWEICRAHLDHDAPLPALPPADSTLFSGHRALLPADFPWNP